MVVRDDPIAENLYDDSYWVIDSGASTYASSRLEVFSSYKACDLGYISMSNGSLFKVVGIGNVNLWTNNGSRLVSRNVKYVSNIIFDILFIGWLASDGYFNVFLGESWKLIKRLMVVACGFRSFNFS